jgi:hypothetical protein
VVAPVLNNRGTAVADNSKGNDATKVLPGANNLERERAQPWRLFLFRGIAACLKAPQRRSMEEPLPPTTTILHSPQLNTVPATDALPVCAVELEKRIAEEHEARMKGHELNLRKRFARIMCVCVPIGAPID